VLAIAYLLLVLIIGHVLCHRFYHFHTLPQRYATNFLVGLLVCTLATYLLALAFARSADPLFHANLIFSLGAVAIIFWFYKPNPLKQFSIKSLLHDPGTNKWDWLFTAVFFAASIWLTFGTFRLVDGNLRMDSVLWNDYGPNLSLIRSFSVGRNFPTEYPHFIGEPIRYHFLFWFQAGNLEYLGLNIANSLNLLSALTLTAMLTLISSLGHILFGSKAVGRIGATFFFFSGTLSFIPYLLAQHSLMEAFNAVINAKEWLKSIYPYTGEQWGAWSLGIFLNQKHFPTAIGVFFIIITFLVEQVGKKYTPTQKTPEVKAADFTSPPSQTKTSRQDLPAYIFSGLLLGLLPLWNGAVFVAGLAVVGALLLLFPQRIYMLYLLAAAMMIAIPQMLFLKSGQSLGLFELLHWGYVVQPPTIENVLKYFSFTFGVKTFLALAAMALLSNFHRRLFLAFFCLVIVAFATKLSTDVMNNHKFLNIWLTLINLFAAYTLYRLARLKAVGKIVAVAFFVVIMAGGTIELFRIKNDNTVDVPFERGALYEWLARETDAKDIFLTEKHVHHPIFLAGRRAFYGWPYFGWSMGYPTGARDVIYNKMYEEKNPLELMRLLKQQKIAFVAFDQNLRQGSLQKSLNEAVFEANFDKVFVDKENKYGALVIYKVADRVEPDKTLSQSRGPDSNQ
jgi:hypothetical protein